MTAADPILSVRDLSVTFGGRLRAVDDVSFDVGRGEFLGVVGESGCGKSTLLFAITQLLDAPAVISGSVRFAGQDLVRLDERALRHSRWRDYSIVMQSAMNALNPVKSVGAQFRDVLRAHGVRGSTEIERRSTEAFRLVGIDSLHLRSYPHQLSGGMRQRAMIAMALLFSPELVVMDEPTSALDVVAQRALMVQIKQLQRRLGFAVVFVTHDMSLVSHFSDRMIVMYAGQVAELGPTRRVFERPRHPYAAALLDAFPSVRGERVALRGIPGSPPDLAHPPAGCRFAPRCAQVMDRCATEAPELYGLDGESVRCLRYAGGSSDG